MSLQDKINQIPLMEPEDIDIRIGQIGRDGDYITLLLYKNARVDMQILDDVFGTFGWARSHREVKGNLYCAVNLWDEENKQWVPKEDVGTESNTEAEKGEASDSFKRACVNVGIGRELYTAPFIKLKPPLVEIKKDTNGRWTCRDRFAVDNIEYTNRKISRLVIVKTRSNGSDVVYTFDKKTKKPPQPIKYDTQPKVTTDEIPTSPQEEKERKDTLYKLDYKIIQLANLRGVDVDAANASIRKKLKVDGNYDDLSLDRLNEVFDTVCKWIDKAKENENTSEN